MSERLEFDGTIGADTAITADPSGDPNQLLIDRYGHLLPKEAFDDPTCAAAIIIQAIQDCEL